MSFSKQSSSGSRYSYQIREGGSFIRPEGKASQYHKLTKDPSYFLPGIETRAAKYDQAYGMSKRRRVNGNGRGARGYVGQRGALMSYLPETKYFDVACSLHPIATANDWTGTEVPMDNFIQGDGSTVGAYTDSALIPSAQGTGYGELLGTRYRLKAIRIKGHVLPGKLADQADANPARVVRIVLVMDTNANASQAQGETVFTDFGLDAINVHSFLNMGTTTGKFRILRDMRLMLQPAYGATDGANTQSNVKTGSLFHMQWKPKKPIVITLAASAATPATSQLQSHNIFVLALTDDESIPSINFVSRAYYCE